MNKPSDSEHDEADDKLNGDELRMRVETLADRIESEADLLKDPPAALTVSLNHTKGKALEERARTLRELESVTFESAPQTYRERVVCYVERLRSEADTLKSTEADDEVDHDYVKGEAAEDIADMLTDII